MSRKLVLPFFPVPPEQYDQQYMEEVMRAFSVYMTQVQNPGEGRNTELVLTNLQLDDQGLEVGAIFKLGTTGNLRIVVADIPHVRGTGSIGSITVTV